MTIFVVIYLMGLAGSFDLLHAVGSLDYPWYTLLLVSIGWPVTFGLFVVVALCALIAYLLWMVFSFAWMILFGSVRRP